LTCATSLSFPRKRYPEDWFAMIVPEAKENEETKTIALPTDLRSILKQLF
jgi:hypothetical protein